jgi:hypothetical protein
MLMIESCLSVESKQFNLTFTIMVLVFFIFA